MILDFRLRPPYKDFLNLSIFKGRPVPEDPALLTAFELGREPVPSAIAKSMDMFFKEMDECGISQGVLMGRQADNFGEVSNDQVKELVDLHPGRFIPFAGINPRHAGAVEEVERTMKGWGFRGISVDPGWLNPPVMGDDALFDAVYDKCHELGGILVVTVSAALGPDLTYSDPVIVQHIATKYPNMKIVVPHACWPHVERMLAVAMRCPNVYLVPDCYLYIEHMPGADQFVQAANSFLKYRTLFASTYPVRSIKQSLEGWKKRSFTPEALELSLYGNAARLLGL